MLSGSTSVASLLFVSKAIVRILRSLYAEIQSQLRTGEMQTSLRYGNDSKSLQIHAKESFPLFHSKSYLKVYGELDISGGNPSFFAVMLQNFYPEVSASTGIGIQYDKHQQNFKYSIRGKKAFPISSTGLLSFDFKGRYDVDKELRETKATGAAELAWSILNFQQDQDVQLKLGYDISDKVPYLKLRENNWTRTANLNGRWNMRLNL